MALQSLSLVCNVTVNISPVVPAAPTFNQGLIVGTSTVIPSYGASSRVRSYTSTGQMLTDGFLNSSPEFLAAQLYFSQTPAPQILCVGRQDLTAIQTATIAAAGTGYAVGDLLTVVQSGASNGVYQVTSIGASGQVTGISQITAGTGYSVATGLATTGGTGASCTITISAIGETALAALQACRIATAAWWGAMVCGSSSSDHTAIAAWIGSATPASAYFYVTSDSAVVNNSANNVAAQLKAGTYRRVIGTYSTTQSGAAPNNAYSAAAVLGEAMGLNTGLANSAFTMKFKTLTGVTAEPSLTYSQVSAIESNNCNVYIPYQGGYVWFEQGTMADGSFLDELLGLDMLASDIQTSCVNTLISVPSVPHDDIGQGVLIDTVNQACLRAQQRGFIAPSGTWTGQQVLNLTSGKALPKGFLVQSAPFSQQSQADKIARKAMPIYATLIEARSMHSITIGVYES